MLTRADRAVDTRHPPVYVAGIAEQTALRGFQNEDNLLRPWLTATAQQLWASTGVKPDDIDALYVQDATSVWVLQMIEAYGFCPRGEVGAFLGEGHTRPGASLPVNTNGGQLSESYLWGWLHLCEAVRQLRLECGPRQIPNPRYALDCSSHDFLKAAATLLTVNT